MELEHLGRVLADQISTLETAEQSKILLSCPWRKTNDANRVLAQQIRWRQTGKKFGLGFKLMRGLVGQASTKYVLAKYFNPEQGPSVSPQD